MKLETRKSTRFEHSVNDVDRASPRLLTIGGVVHRGLLCSQLGLATHYDDDRPVYAVLSLAVGADRVALFQPFDAKALRALAASMLATADELDQGKGKQ